MKKFVFSLERMLTYQVQNLDKEKGILGRLTAEKDWLETRKSEMQTSNAKIRREMERQERDGTTVFVLKGYYSMLESGRKQLEMLEAKLAAITVQMEQQRKAVIAASQEVKKLEKLKETQLEEYRRNEAKEQQEIISEHVAETFVRNGVSI